ncbi:MAG: ATP-binding protein [Flavitalea sp.]
MINTFKYLLTLIITIALFGAAYSQTKKIDSLRMVMAQAPSQETKLDAVILLCEQHQSLNRDSLDKYAILATQLSQQTNNERYRALAQLAMANSYMRWGWTDSAMATIEPGLKKYPSAIKDYRDIHFKLARAKALCYGFRSKFKEALDILYAVVNDAEQYRDSISLGTNMNTIGSIALARDDPHEAIKWFNKALAVSTRDSRFTPVLSAIYINMANAYHSQQKDDSALLFIQKGMPLSREIENLNILATALRVQSNIYLSQNKIPLAEAALQEMIGVREKTNDGTSQIDDGLQLIDFYTRTKQFEKAIALCRSKLITGNVYDSVGQNQTFSNNIQVRLLLYQALARVYQAAGNDELYRQTLEQIIAAKDSAYDEGAAKAIAEIQTRYEVQKKENTIIQQKLDLTTKNYVLYGSVLLTILVAIIGWLLFKNYSRKQRLKMTLMQIEEKRITALAVKNAEEKERVRIAADLHDNLGAYAASISSNLDYIKIPEADAVIRNALQELRINAQSIVSQLSDTIWALNKETLSLTAISDRIKVLLQRMRRNYPDVMMEVAEKITMDHSLPPSQAFHLFRIVQEAVTNSLKHSAAKNIIVSVEGNDSWKIEITDDGSGMKIDPGNKMGGNGVLNMSKRAAESGWQIEWVAVSPRGTAVIIHNLFA